MVVFEIEGEKVIWGVTKNHYFMNFEFGADFYLTGGNLATMQYAFLI